jgi:hypothetical protein
MTSFAWRAVAGDVGCALGGGGETATATAKAASDASARRVVVSVMVTLLE